MIIFSSQHTLEHTRALTPRTYEVKTQRQIENE